MNTKQVLTDEQIARLFYETASRMAPSFGYEGPAEPFDPEAPSGKALMAVCGAVLSALAAQGEAQPVEPMLRLSGFHLRDALSFVAPDGTDEQLADEVCIQHGPERSDDEGTQPAGFFCWLAEYPEEGSVRLDDEPPSAAGRDALKGPIPATTPPAAPAVSQPGALPAPFPRLTVQELLAMYDERKGDWCAIARGVEDHYIKAIEATTPPAAPAISQPVALQSVELTRDTHGTCIVKVNGRVAIRDNGDVISHFATPDWFATPPAAPSAEARDAARWRFLRDEHEARDSGETFCVFQPVTVHSLEPVGSMPGELDAAIDAALAAHGGAVDAARDTKEPRS